MASLKRHYAMFIVTALMLIGLSAPPPAEAANSSQLVEQPVILQKDSPAVSASIRRFLETRDPQTAAVWVFFTDKQVFTPTQFQTLAAEVRIDEKVLARREKVGAGRVMHLDLPVPESYIERVESAGGKLRRVSKWLNAASFDIPLDKLDSVAALSFVASVRPVARFAPGVPVDDQSPSPSVETALTSDVLNYGSSLLQLQQIKVPELHQKGFGGQGVTLAIFDSGYRKSHEAFDQAFAEGRVLDEWDFVFNDGNTANQTADISNQWNHGTSVWGVVGGQKDGTLYGPAYKANFLLAKTEDQRSETPVEEDNWVAALEWADSLGADVITSSLSYPDFYTYEQLDGQTATITIAANMADSLGIVLCNSVGNRGPNPGTLNPPSDAHNVLACGAVTPYGGIASFSSRGPTYDGRVKPEVLALGVNTYTSAATADNSYGTATGTSYSTPLVAGAVCVLLSAHPDYTPEMIRLALKETASRADSPNNDYGWGLIDLERAYYWGADFTADITTGDAPLTVQFTEQAGVTATSWYWEFGDGDVGYDTNPVHEYTDAGAYDVSLTIESSYGSLTTVKEAYIQVFADTLKFGADSAFAGQTIMSSIYLTNGQPINQIIIPFAAEDAPLDLTFDSLRLGARTEYFDRFEYLDSSHADLRFTVRLTANFYGGATPLLDPGSGEVLRVFWSTGEWETSCLVNPIDTVAGGAYKMQLVSDAVTYVPEIVAGEARTICVLRGDMNYDGKRNLADISRLIAFVYLHGDRPVTLKTADVNDNGKINLADISNLISFVYLNGKDPVYP